MKNIDLPPFPYQIQKKKKKHYIYDVVRKKEVFLTPEEWVRQHMIHYLNKEKRYPLGRMGIEKKISKEDRADILLFNKEGKIHMIIECKAPHIPLNWASITQLGRYGSKHSSPYWVLTNGISLLVFEKKERGYFPYGNIPFFSG